MDSSIISDLLALMECWQTRLDHFDAGIAASENDQQRDFLSGTNFAYHAAREELALLLARAVEQRGNGLSQTLGNN